MSCISSDTAQIVHNVWKTSRTTARKSARTLFSAFSSICVKKVKVAKENVRRNVSAWHKRHASRCREKL